MIGVIAAGHTRTADAGAQMLRRGGNAVDAAVAAAFMSFISEAGLVNIGGGGIAMVVDPQTGQNSVYDFFSNMPGVGLSGSFPPKNMDFRRVLIDFGPAQQPFYIGRASVAVPGAVAGLCKMLEEQGTLPLATVLEPAIIGAQEGVVLTHFQAYTLSLLLRILTDTPRIRKIFSPGGNVAEVGQRLAFPALAKTLEQLGHDGAALFYTGAVGDRIVVDQRAHGGLITRADLAAYEVRRMPPIEVEYRGYRALIPRPSSGGGVLIAFALHLLNTVSLEGIKRGSYAHLRILIEIMRFTNIARAAWNNSGSNIDIVRGFLDTERIEFYAEQLKRALATESSPPDAPTPPTHPNTSHLSVADANGMVVSMTTSAGENAGFVVADTGVMLNNMLGEIDLHPNGFHRFTPGKRLSTMMSPVVVLKDGQPVLAVGSGGSNRLRTAILQVISNVCDFGLPLNEAIDASRIHFEDNVTQLEGGVEKQAANLLDDAGYTTNRWPYRNMFFGGVHSVALEQDAQGKRWVAHGDRRREGTALVVA